MTTSQVELVMDRLHGIEDRMTEHGKEMRNGFADLSRQFAEHAKEDHAVEGRVLLLEADRRSGNERRKEDQARVDRRTGVVATVVTLVLGFVYFLAQFISQVMARK